MIPAPNRRFCLTLVLPPGGWNPFTKRLNLPSSDLSVFICTSVFHAHSNFPQLNYHLYTPLPHLATLSNSDQPQATFFMSDCLRQELTQRSEATRAAHVVPLPILPDELQGYHSLVPLDHPVGLTKERRPNFGAWHSSVYKATSSTDGHAYVLRRIESMYLQKFVHLFFRSVFQISAFRMRLLSVLSSTGRASDIQTSSPSVRPSPRAPSTTVVCATLTLLLSMAPNQ